MNTRQLVKAFWAGEKPHPIPFTIYHNEWRLRPHDPRWIPLFQQGLGLTWPQPTYQRIYTGGVEYFQEMRSSGAKTIRHEGYRTPKGEVNANWDGEWPLDYYLKCPQDYTVMKYIVDHTQIIPNYNAYLEFEQKAPEYIIPHADVGPSPIQKILVDWAGLENFIIHLYEYPDAVMSLYDSLRKQFRRICEIVAEGPGEYVACPESFSAETLGPKRFRQYILSVYEECFPMLQSAGKIVGAHFDGQTLACREMIRSAPLDLIESLTPPPEGDQTLAEARASWSDKLFWVNINVSAYTLPPSELSAYVHMLVNQGSVDGCRLAFEVSEDTPQNWYAAIPVILNALQEI